MKLFLNGIKFSSLTLAVLTLAGCNQGLTDLQQYVQQTKTRPPGKVEPIPTFSPYQNFEYMSESLRDPFKVVDFRRPETTNEDINTATTGPKPDLDRIREPLEDFPLDTLRFKGTVIKDGIMWGLVFAPDNTIHRVQEDNYMGQNFGRIVSLTETEIELTEIVPDGLGNYIERSAALALIE